MSVRLYDEALYKKIQSWIITPNMRILKVDETKELFKNESYLNNDQPIKLPIISLSRDKNIDFTISTKRNLSYDGLRLESSTGKTVMLNAIPFTTNYQIDIYTQKYEEADEYLRELLFNLINNPKLEIEIPYNGINLIQSANLRVVPTVEDTSDIPERLFRNQFTRWTITLELQDAYIFNTPIKNNWKMEVSDSSLDVEENIAKYSVDIDYEDSSSLSHDGFTHIAEKESNE